MEFASFKSLNLSSESLKAPISGGPRLGEGVHDVTITEIKEFSTGTGLTLTLEDKGGKKHYEGVFFQEYNSDNEINRNLKSLCLAVFGNVDLMVQFLLAAGNTPSLLHVLRGRHLRVNLALSNYGITPVKDDVSGHWVLQDAGSGKFDDDVKELAAQPFEKLSEAYAFLKEKDVKVAQMRVVDYQPSSQEKVAENATELQAALQTGTSASNSASNDSITSIVGELP
jgi:hypothetical protein